MLSEVFSIETVNILKKVLLKLVCEMKNIFLSSYLCNSIYMCTDVFLLSASPKDFIFN